jgi:YgiT-type zinc finger domain-containing protein
VKCVLCEVGEVHVSAEHRAEVKVGTDRLLVHVEAEVCGSCGEVYYSPDALRHMEKVRRNLLQRKG